MSPQSPICNYEFQKALKANVVEKPDLILSSDEVHSL